ncbi:uncharacterized protein CANTADRAFT_27486 [Suhomyces tanzawaensis NRRL Y-17324]|uniref:Uncharacterized protein n=1 Tax=Suhomyces tanzawaensis NRRL Y-17324 TaxID=984487 RepID=A0A1E4SC86_9ASCO|nr:uncharacterized protein CANTADRAFT_27486 [Suhomyces tanzawaensis NRRL Y-17324]ODV77109.1 hypothetical protein CANTADRAFT_27486 [Suhomyces tanzawaensis NRRL Y-17324]
MISLVSLNLKLFQAAIIELSTSSSTNSTVFLSSRLKGADSLANTPKTLPPVILDP